MCVVLVVRFVCCLLAAHLDCPILLPFTCSFLISDIMVVVIILILPDLRGVNTWLVMIEGSCENRRIDRWLRWRVEAR